mmetsp:Transcript_18880/g.38417  ORF Transcript_18880/g.38417 Transcript_18880/m.38417 type:complete len:218 (+) Transcript_18880:1831-2484(+)
MCRVARLEGVDRVGLFRLERGAELIHGEAKLVEAIVVLYASEQLHLATDGEVLARRKQLLDVGVLVVLHAPRPHNELTNAQLVYLRRPKDRKGDARRVSECDGSGTLDVPASEVRDGQNDRDRHRDALLRELVLHPLGVLERILANAGEVIHVDEHRVKVERLHERSLTHEALERRGPALCNHLQPVDVNVGEGHLGQHGCLCLLSSEMISRHDHVD